MSNSPKETFVQKLVTYTAEVEGRIIVVEHVPARVCVETGEELFAPETVETLDRIVKGERTPARVLSATIYDFAA